MGANGTAGGPEWTSRSATNVGEIEAVVATAGRRRVGDGAQLPLRSLQSE